QLEEADTHVRGERDQLYEVVENLVQNAVKYSSENAQVSVCVCADLSRDSAEHMGERIDPESGRLTLTAPALAAIIRVNRAEMIEVLHQDFIVTARAHGISQFRIVAVYALRNAMIPTLAMIGLRYGWMLGGTVLVEGVFDWPGIGLYAVQSAVNSDFQPVMGVTLLIGLSFMLANFLIDIAYGWLDPRLRETG
ncbi:MAG: ABC transporter permease subunit, partial [Kiloniellales bacterium]|nr:ABC transporter permease subunit [Kiloniellales bacterium]